MSELNLVREPAGSVANRLAESDRACHDWYRFVLSFPAHLVRQYLERFRINSAHCVLDPFCGTGTTLVECKKLGIPSIGIEALALPHFAASVKVNWDGDPARLLRHAQGVRTRALRRLTAEGIEDFALFAGCESNGKELRSLDPERHRLLLNNSISPLPLHKTLVLLECMAGAAHGSYTNYERLALAKALVASISNLHFGPEVGLGRVVEDAPVIQPWFSNVRVMVTDLDFLRAWKGVPATVQKGDSREIGELVEPESIDAVFTSPPYPNEKDYTRTTRLEAVLLGFLQSRLDLRAAKESLLRSNTRCIFKTDSDDRFVEEHPEIRRIAAQIEKRRIELNKTSGFERLYHRVVRLYFGGMLLHLRSLQRCLRPGAHLAYVVGDQASYLRVMIRTGQLLANIASSLGYEVIGIDLFRTRLATATREQMREEVLLLRWPGRGSSRFGTGHA